MSIEMVGRSALLAVLVVLQGLFVEKLRGT